MRDMRTIAVAIALLLAAAVAGAAPVPVTIVPAVPNDLSPIAAIVPFQCSMTASTVVNGFVVRSIFTPQGGCVEIGPPVNSVAQFGPLPPGTYTFEAYDESSRLYATTTFTVTSTAIPTLSEITRALLLLALSATGVWSVGWRGGSR